LGGSYVIAKGRSLRAHVVELDEDALRYGDRRIPYRSIRGLRRGWVDAGGARRSLLARSWIYALETEDGTIQILGKFYPNDEAMMQRIAERSGVTIQDD
jgi:hypothetical protein